MPVFVERSEIAASDEELFRWHERPGAFERLAPPWNPPRVVERQGTIRDGDRLVFEMGGPPFRQRWVAVHRDFEQGRGFVDEQERGPFARWVHAHRFLSLGSDRSTLEDQVEYELPFGAVGSWLGGRVTQRMLKRMFRFRHTRTRNDLSRHGMFSNRDRLRIAITGSSGTRRAASRRAPWR